MERVPVGSGGRGHRVLGLKLLDAGASDRLLVELMSDHDAPPEFDADGVKGATRAYPATPARKR
jgi:hypothetical protein